MNALKRTKKDQWLKFGKLCTTPGQWGLLSGQVQIKDDPHLVNQLEFYVEGPKKTRNYLVDGASLKVSKVPESFYEKANSEIDRLRKVDLTVEAGYPEYSNVTISISQVKHDFPFGSGWFSIRFTTFAMLRFFELLNWSGYLIGTHFKLSMHHCFPQILHIENSSMIISIMPYSKIE